MVSWSADLATCLYRSLESRGIIGSDGNLTAEYDAAAANWGGSWRMPTLDEIQELIDNCTWEQKVTMNGVYGNKVIGPNGNFIFLPSAGYRNGTSLPNVGSYSGYWSATPDGDSGRAGSLTFNSSVGHWELVHLNFGFAVRPVTE